VSYLGVHIHDGAGHRTVTRVCTGLEFTRIAPGGYSYARMRLNLPRNAFDDLGPADRVWITDPRTGDTVWEGFAENPGPVDGAAGQEWDLTAVGSMVVADDLAKPVVYIDTDLNAWEPDNRSSIPAFATMQVTGYPRGEARDGLLLGFQTGQNVLLSNNASMAYARLSDAGQGLAAIAVTGRSGKNDSGYRVQLHTRSGTIDDSRVLFSDIGMVDEWNDAIRVIGTSSGPPAGVHRVALRLIRTTGSGNVADDNTWTFLTRISVVGRRMDKYGELDTGPDDIVSATHVEAHWVVADVVARFLPMVDPARSEIAAPTSPYPIDQLVWTEGVRASGIFDALEQWQPEMLWEILDSRPARGFRSNYRPWPTDVRYVLSAQKDSFRSPGAEVDLCNRVLVEWTDARGNRQTLTVTSTVPELDAVGRVHDAQPVTLPVGRGSAALAQRAGELVLAQKAKAPAAGRAVVSRRILDRKTGSSVMPWEIEPGYPALVRERNLVLPITENRYDDEAGAAQLELGRPVLTETQLLAQLMRKTR